MPKFIRTLPEYLYLECMMKMDIYEFNFWFAHKHSTIIGYFSMDAFPTLLLKGDGLVIEGLQYGLIYKTTPEIAWIGTYKGDYQPIHPTDLEQILASEGEDL